MAHAVDKEPINEVAYAGQSLLSDSPIAPTSQMGRAVDQAITKYPFDLRRSEALMAEAGMTRGSDGTYTSPSEGRFTSEIKTNAASDNELEMSALASGWRQAGFDVRDSVLAAALAQDNEARSTYTGIFSNNTGTGEAAMLARVSSAISRPDNRWAGGNRGGYSNPEYDRLAAAYTTELQREQRICLMVDMGKILADDVPAINLFFRTQPWVHTAALTGPRMVAPESNMSWRIHEWEFR